MPDSAEFKINVVTTATGAGAEKTAADLEVVKEKTQAATAAVKDYTAAAQTAGAAPLAAALQKQRAQQEMELMTAETDARAARSGGDEAGFAAARAKVQALKEALGLQTQSLQVSQMAAAAEERGAAIARQKTAIIEQETEALKMQAAGRLDEAAEMQANLALARESLAIQIRTREEEMVADAMARERMEAKATILATEEAQEELNAQMVAEEEARLEAVELRAKQEAKIAVILAEQQAETTGLMAKEAQQAEMQAAMREDRVTRGLGREAGLGRSTGLLGAFGPEAITAAASLEILFKMYEGLTKASEEASKRIAEDSKRAAQSIKEIGESARKSMAEATAGAAEFGKALAAVDALREKGLARREGEINRGARGRVQEIDDKEIADLIGVGDPVKRAEISAKAKQARADAEADAKVLDADLKTKSAREHVEAVAQSGEQLKEPLSAAQAEFARASDQAARSRASAEEARLRPHAISKKAHEDSEAASNPISSIIILKNAQRDIERARKGAAASEEMAKTDEEARIKAKANLDALNKAVDDLGEKSRDAAQKVKEATEEQKLSEGEAATTRVKAAQEADKAIAAARKEADEKALRESQRDKAQEHAAVSGIVREDKASDAVAKGAEIGVEKGMGKAHAATGHAAHGVGHQGSHGGAHYDPFTTPTDFADSAATHVGAGEPSADFERAFGKHRKDNDPNFDRRTSADRTGSANDLAAQATGAIKAGSEAIKGTAGKTQDEVTRELIATIHMLSDHLAGGVASNKQDQNHQALEREVQALKEKVQQLASQAANNR